MIRTHNAGSLRASDAGQQVTLAGWVATRPMPAERLARPMAPPVAIIAFDGMQSSRCAAPPTISRSMMVTSAPMRAARVAAALPPGPPPMITSRFVTHSG